jgi:hypothetical protein
MSVWRRGGRRRKGEALPLGSEAPVAVVDRIDLERLGHQRDVELHAHRRVVRLAWLHLATIDHMPRGDVLDDRERLGERRKAELQATRGYAVLARERLKRKPDALRDVDRFLVEPIPARPRQVEVGREIERHALVDGVLQAAVEFELEARVEAPAVGVRLQGRALHRDRVGLCRRGHHKAHQQGQRTPGDRHEPKRKKAFDRHRFWKRA